MYTRKTKSALKKRFKITGNGGIKVPYSCKRHGMRKRSSNKIRERGMKLASHAETVLIKSMMIGNTI